MASIIERGTHEQLLSYHGDYLECGIFIIKSCKMKQLSNMELFNLESENNNMSTLKKRWWLVVIGILFAAIIGFIAWGLDHTCAHARSSGSITV